jgi:hypothetical protein
MVPSRTSQSGAVAMIVSEKTDRSVIDAMSVPMGTPVGQVMPKMVLDYRLIRYSDIITRMSLQKENICSSDSSSEDPTNDKEKDLVSILGIVLNLS